MKINYRLSYPTNYLKQLKPLLHQQMWLFGRDILCPDGNLLHQYEFTHHRAKDHGSSMYTLSSEEQQIVLWGWGIWFGRAEMGAIFVNRYKALPRFTAVATLPQTIHREAALPHLTQHVATKLHAQAMSQLWTELLQWLAAYETWVLNKFGLAWRQAALKPFPHAVTQLADVDRLASQWHTLAEESQRLTIKSASS